MADYFTNISLIVELPTKDAQEYALNVANEASRIQQGDEASPDFPAVLMDVVEDWSFETDPESLPDKYGIWLHSYHGGVDAICAFIQHLLRKFNPQGHVAFEWSHDCSKPRIDAYGGGAAIITAKNIKTMSTGEWLQRQIHRAQSKHTAATAAQQQTERSKYG